MTITFKQPKSVACVFDMKHVKGTRATVILYRGEIAGRIVANFSDNPAGSVCTAVVMVWSGPLKDMPVCTGKAGGYGYDKLSAAINSAISGVIDDIGEHTPPQFGGAGMSVVHAWFRSFGYDLCDVI